MMENNGSNGMNFTRKIAAACCVAASGAALLLSGCAAGLNSDAVSKTFSPSGNVSGLHGKVMGGQYPVANAVIQVYEVGLTGNASASKPLISSTTQISGLALTDANGAFNITGQYVCDNANSMVYITATGGNPNPGSPANSALALMAGLGNCYSLVANAATTSIQLNEVTTVGSVYALSGFMSGYATVGYASANMAGMTDAFATENALVSTSAGTVAGAASGITLPSAKLYSLANSIAACVNSTGPTSMGCSGLFTATTVSGTAPTDTIGALVNIAHNPAANVSAIYTLSAPQPPFGGALAVAPADWTMPVVYTGNGLATPSAIAIDAAGSAWVANGSGNDVTKLTAGTFASGTTGYAAATINGPQGIAIDVTGNIWLANTGAANVLELSSAGAVLNTVTTGVTSPLSIAMDNSNPSIVWVTNFDSSTITAFNSSTRTAATGSPYSSSGNITSPTGLAIDVSGNVYVSSSVTGTVAKLTKAGALSASYTDGLMVAPGGVAYDPILGNVFTAATGINTITALTATGTASTISGGSLSMPTAVAVDGASTVWAVGPVTAGSLAAFSSTGTVLTPAAGLGTLNAPVNLAVDDAGNIWTADSGDSTVTEFVGVATPIVTPLIP